MTSLRAALFIVPLSLVFGACAASDGDDTGEEGYTAPASQELRTRTIVHVDENGVEKLTVQYVTQAELDQETEAREQLLAGGDVGKISQAITHDGSCAGSSLWLQDDFNQAGNRICFYGAGTANLGTYCHLWYMGTCWSTWAAKVKSYWSGSDAGRFGSHYCCQGCTSNTFSAYQRVDTASSCVQGTSIVHLGTCTPC